MSRIYALLYSYSGLYTLALLIAVAGRIPIDSAATGVPYGITFAESVDWIFPLLEAACCLQLYCAVKFGDKQVFSLTASDLAWVVLPLIASANGHGIHFVANCIEHALPPSSGQLETLTYFHHEYLSHNLWNAGRVLVLAVIAQAECQAGRVEKKQAGSGSWTSVCGGALWALVVAFFAIGTRTVIIHSVFAFYIQYLCLTGRKQKDGLGAVTTYLRLVTAILLATFVGWIIFHKGGCPTFDDLSAASK